MNSTIVIGEVPRDPSELRTATEPRCESESGAMRGNHSGDSAAAAAAAEMDDRWIEEIYPSLHRAAWMMTGDRSAAEDLAQEALVVAFSRWHRYDGRGSRAGWVHGILVRLTRKHFRTLSRLRRRLEVYFDRNASVAQPSDPAGDTAQAEWRECVWAEVAKLPRRQAEAIALRYGQQLEYADVAEILNCSVGTVKSRVHHGLKRLRLSATLQP